MKLKAANRTVIVANAAFWAVSLWFPFARLFSVPTMHTLSNVVALFSLLFPVALVIMSVALYRKWKGSLSPLKLDLALAVFSVLADIALVSAVGKGLL
ncbi:MAG TPA: hypothetical protein VF865_19225 [Acidobacteriaceae bacterium]